MMRQPSRLATVAAFASLYVIWGSTYLAIFFAIESIPPFLMAGTRFLCAGIIMFLIARINGTAREGPGSWRSAFIVGGCLLLCGNGGVTISERWVPTGLASLLVATVPIYMAVLAWLTRTAPRPTRLVMAGLIGGMIGVGVLVAPTLTTLSSQSTRHVALGMCILLIGSFIWSVGSLYSRTVENSSSLFLSAGQQMICGGGLLFLLGMLLGEYRDFHPARISSLSIGAFIYLVLIGALVGYTAYFWLLQHCDPAKVATYAYVNPLVAVALGTLFAGERLTARTVIAAVLIIGSVAIVITGQQLKAKVFRGVPAAFAEAD